MNDLREKFFEDPSWAEMEKLILSYIEPLLDMSTVDLDVPADSVKVEIKGRILAYNSLMKFLNDSKVITRPLPTNHNPFK